MHSCRTFFRVALFSCFTFFGLFSYCTFFVLHYFHVAPFSFAYFLLQHSFHAAIFSCYTFSSLDLNFWPVSFLIHFMVPFSSLLFLTLRTFHIAIFHVALISCCTFSLYTFLMLYSFHITLSQSVEMAAILKLHLIMQLFQWVFKAADLLRTFSVFLYKILQQYFSMVDKNDILWSWPKDLMGCAQ